MFSSEMENLELGGLLGSSDLLLFPDNSEIFDVPLDLGHVAAAEQQQRQDDLKKGPVVVAGKAIAGGGGDPGKQREDLLQEVIEDINMGSTVSPMEIKVEGKWRTFHYCMH